MSTVPPIELAQDRREAYLPGAPSGPATVDRANLRSELGRHALVDQMFWQTNLGGNPPLSADRMEQLVPENNSIATRILGIFDGMLPSARGLGYTVNDRAIDSAPIQNQIASLRQIAWMDQRNIDALGRLRQGVLRTAFERSLYRKGYRKISDDQPDRAVQVQQSTTVGAWLEAAGAQGTIAEMQQSNNGDPVLIGALQLEAAVPAGWFIHLDADGRPLFAAPQDVTGSLHAPHIPLFRVEEPRPQEQGNQTRLQEHAEFLRHVLQPGDILLSRRNTAMMDFLGFAKLIRLLSARTARDGEVPHTHALVYTRDNNVTHIGNRIGGENMTLEETLKEYARLSVVRIQADAEDRAHFAESVEHFAEGKEFHRAGFIPYGIELTRKKIGNLLGMQVQIADTTVQGNKMVCVDLVSEVAKQSSSDSIRSLGNIGTPLDIMQHRNVRWLYSVDALS